MSFNIHQLIPGVPLIRSCKHTRPAASSRHLAALAKLSSCKSQCSTYLSSLSKLLPVLLQGLCPISRDIVCRDWVPHIPFAQVPLLAAAAPGISSRPVATTSTFCCLDLSRQFHRTGEHTGRQNQLERCPAISKMLILDEIRVDICWNVCWYLLKCVLILFQHISNCSFDWFQHISTSGFNAF